MRRDELYEQYPFLAGLAPLVATNELHVVVFLAHDDGRKGRVTSYGRTVDEAVDRAVALLDDQDRENLDNNGPTGWAMDEWEAL